MKITVTPKPVEEVTLFTDSRFLLILEPEIDYTITIEAEGTEVITPETAMTAFIVSHPILVGKRTERRT